MSSKFPTLTADEAAALIPDRAMLGLSGFTAAGSPKAVPPALAARARRLHGAGDPFKIRLLTGASTGAGVDDALAEADAISWRAPFQSSKPLRDRINAGQVDFLDLHLSHVPQAIEFGFLGKIDTAIVEATDITPDGRVYLTTGLGITPTLLRHAEKVIIEINRRQSPRLWEMHDIATLPPPPARSPIPINTPLCRMGVPFAAVDPRKVVGIVETDASDGVSPFTDPDDLSARIAQHVVQFLLDERAAGRIPEDFLPIQAGVGNVSNAVMRAIGWNPDIPPFEMFTEVIQEAQIELIENGRIRGASTCALYVSDPVMQTIFEEMDFFSRRLVLRPQELSNNPGIVRRLGVIGLNTILEMDLTGCANSTHICGTQMMNGIGGSGDFTRNCYLSILMAPSITKGGKISTVVPMVSHVDHNEHSVQILVTEQGLADLRGLGPHARAKRIIENCAHPMYRDYLHRSLESSPKGHLRQDLAHCFDLHQNYLRTGSMLPV